MTTETVLRCDRCREYGATKFPMRLGGVLYQPDLCGDCRAEVSGWPGKFGFTAVTTSDGRKIHPGGFTTQQARDWATANGREFPAHGRLPNELLDEYRKARDAPPVPPRQRPTGKRIVQRRTTARTVDDEWGAYRRIIRIGGMDREFFTIGALAKALGRQPGTIRKWEADELLPKATFRQSTEDPRGEHRLYTRAQIEGIVRIATEEGLMNGDGKAVTSTDFTRRVFELFRELATND